MEDFLGVPGVSLWITLGLIIAAVITTFVGTVTGTAGGLMLLALMTLFFPLAVLIPPQPTSLAPQRYPLRGVCFCALGQVL